MERTWLPVDLSSWTWAIRGSLPSPLSLECSSALHSNSGNHFQGLSLERKQCVVENTWRVHMTQPGKGLCTTFNILVDRCGDLLIWWPLKANLVSKFSCLLNLPPTDLDRSISFFRLSSLFGYRSQFVNQQRELDGKKQTKPKWQINTIVFIH